MIKKKEKRREIWISGKDMTELHFLLALFLPVAADRRWQH